MGNIWYSSTIWKISHEIDFHSYRIQIRDLQYGGRINRISDHTLKNLVVTQSHRILLTPLLRKLSVPACKTVRVFTSIAGVHIRNYLWRSVLKSLAISGTRGSSGFGSHSREQIESRTCASCNTFLAANFIFLMKPFTLLMVRAGDHCDLRMSRQIEPFELMLGW